MKDQELQRRLKTRHISMIAIGGSIGTGIFLASGNAIYTAGPGGAILAYALIGIMVYFLMTSLGEMSTLIPVTGTFCEYSSRFVDPAFGFAMSYNYWFNWAITVAVDLSSASFIMAFWFPHVPFLFWSMLFFFLIFSLNLLAVGFYGESEYWLSIVKVIAILVFIMLGVLMVLGIFGYHAINFHNWVLGDAPFHRGWAGFASVLLVAGFAFQGTEIFGVTAGEAANPRTSVPKAVKSVFWRILLFYILSMLVISFVIPYTDTSLIHSDTKDVALSPFTLVFQKAGLPFAASIINAIILTAVLSACSASLYTATRLLWYISKQGQAHACFSKVTRKGVPINALLATACIGALVFLSSIFGNGNIFVWLVNISALAGFIAWLGIAISHYRFRRAYVAQNKPLSDLPYLSKYFPFAPIFALVLCFGIILAQEFTTSSAHFNWGTFIGTYIGIPVFITLYLGYKFYHKTKLVPLTQCDFEHKRKTPDDEK